MKKIFIVPLIALASGMLASCGGQEEKDDKIDFNIEEFITEKDNHDVQTITIGDYEYYDRQAYFSESKAALWFFNKWDDNLDEDGKATQDTVWAFIANKTAYSKGISKITFTTNEGTGGVKVYATFGDSAFSDAQKTGKSVICTASTEKEYTIESNGTSKYFALSTYGDPGYGVKNLMLNSLTIWFAK